MNIRIATLADARSVAEVHVLSWEHAYRGLIPDAFLSRLSVDKREVVWQRVISKGAPELWIAEKNSEIVGWIAFGPSRDEHAPFSVGEIEAIYILPNHWREGIGRALWLKARHRLMERHFSTATLWVLAENESGIQFYRDLGFSPSHGMNKVIEIGEIKLAEVRYEIAL